MKIKRIILIVFLVLFAGTITYCETAPQRALRKEIAKIPEGIQYYEENEDFFNFLLGIKNRKKELYATDADGLNWGSAYRLNMYGDELVIATSGGTVYPGAANDIFTLEERQWLETIFREYGDINDGGMSIYISMEYVFVGVLSFSFTSPIDAYSWQGYTLRFQTYTEIINSDWTVTVGTRHRI